MKQTMRNKVAEARRGERGEGQMKLVIFLLAVFIGGFAAWQYIPVAYNAKAFEQEMQTVVDQSSAVYAARENPAGWVQKKLAASAPSFGVPAEAAVTVQQSAEAGIIASVKYTTPVNLLPFGIYTYPYEFNHTARTATMLTK